MYTTDSSRAPRFRMSTSQKHADFVRETMKEKPIEALAGVGEKAKEILVSKGFEKAYHLLV